MKIYEIKRLMERNKPEIILGVGIVASVASSIFAYRAAKKFEKAKDIITIGEETIEEVKRGENEVFGPDGFENEQQEENMRNRFKYEYKKELILAFGPSVLFEIGAIGCIVYSQKILRERNAALGAALALSAKTFASYRERVKEKIGAEAEENLFYGREEKTIEVVDEKGKKKKEKVVVTDQTKSFSPYGRVFDETSKQWTPDPEYNKMFLKAQQEYCNTVLRSKGFLYLNDVYKALGFKETKEGQVAGWIYDEKNPNGDNFVDFGMYDINVDGYHDDRTNDTISEERIAFINGITSRTFLDFNVDGNIWEKVNY